MSPSPSRRIQPGSRDADLSFVKSAPEGHEQQVPRTHPRWPGGGPGAAVLVAVPVIAAVAVVVGAVAGTTTVALVVALVAAVSVAAVLALALAAADRVRRETLQQVESLLCALEIAREGVVDDESTGLLNRRGLLLVGRQVLEAARRSGGAVHACIVEVTPAPQLGGSLTAEELRVQRQDEWEAAAAALRGATRTADVVAREEGGRFLVLGPGAGLHSQELERRLRVGLAQSRLAGGGDRGARMSVEVGAAVMAPWDDGGVGDLLVRAEQAFAQRRALRRSAPQQGWGRRRNDQSARPEHPQA